MDTFLELCMKVRYSYLRHVKEGINKKNKRIVLVHVIAVIVVAMHQLSTEDHIFSVKFRLPMEA